MKKFSFRKFLSVLMLVVIAPTILSLSGCLGAESGDTLFVNVERNDSQSKWTGSWLKKYGTKECSLVINRYSFSTVTSHLPKADGMTAPNGKVLGGWYFDSDCSNGNSYNLYNWEQKTVKNGKTTSVSAYAKWIDENYVNVILDLDNNEAEFVESGLKSMEILVPKDDIDNILDYIQQKLEDLEETPQLANSEFAGWSLQKSYDKVDSKAEATVNAIKSVLNSQSYVNLYAMWNYNVDLIEFEYNVLSPDGTTASIKQNHFIQYHRDYGKYEHPYAFRVVTQGKSKYVDCFVFENDSFELMQSYTPTMNDIKVTNSSGKDVSSQYEIVGYKIQYTGDIVDWTEDFIPSNLITDKTGFYGEQLFEIYVVVGKK